MNTEIKVTTKERTVTVVDTIYTCPTCNKESQSKAEIERCVKIHNGAKYQVGDVIEFYYYPSDHRQYCFGVIESIKFDNTGDAQYVTDVTCENIAESQIEGLIMTKSDRKKRLQDLQNIVETLPDTLQWEIEWDDSESCYKVTGKNL